MKLEVWAPLAKQVEALAGEDRHAMSRDEQGYWRVELPLGADEGYRFSLDGGPGFPDPRSRWQRDGVHGPSFEVQLSEAAHFSAAPLKEALIYELHIGTFTVEGTYAAAAGRIPHLKDLGVTHIELLPLATAPGQRGWGYDGVDLFAPLPAYGTPLQLKALIDACHSAGIAVLIDVVYNHFGPDGNYLGAFAPYFTDRYHTPWGQAVNYDDAYSDEVRRFVIDNALMWLRDYGFDGLRLDAVHAIYCFEAMHVLEQLAAEVRQLSAATKRHYVLIAESDLNDPALVRPAASGGYGLDAHWADDFHHALHSYFTGETSGYYADFAGLDNVARALRDGYIFQGQYSPHRRRRHGRAPRGVAAEQLVVCAQNHDQIGNRARGERLSMLLEPPTLKAIAALTLLSPFVPMLFQGEEWGAQTPFLYFTDHNAELGKLVAEGRAREFASFAWGNEVPNPQDEETFLRSKLDWNELQNPAHADLLDWHRQLMRLRREQNHAPRQAKPRINVDAGAGWLVYSYRGICARLNLAAQAQRVPLPRGSWRLALASQPAEESAASMDARSTLIYRETRAA